MDLQSLETAYWGIELLEDGGDPIYGLHLFLSATGECGPYPAQNLNGIEVFLGRELAPTTVQLNGKISMLDQQRVSPLGSAMMTQVALTNVPPNGTSLPFPVTGEITGTLDVQLRRVVQEVSAMGIMYDRTTDEIVGSARGSFVAAHCPEMDRHGFVD